MLRNMFKKTYTKIDTIYRPKAGDSEEPSIPQGLWRKCNKCGQPIYVEDVVNNYYVCPKCDGYFRVHAYRRIETRKCPSPIPWIFQIMRKRWLLPEKRVI